MNNWEQNIRCVDPYVPGEQPAEKNLIKLNTNENPYPPAPGVSQALKQMDPADFRKYPDPAADALVAALAESYGLEKEQVFVGVGSDDVLAMAFLTFFNGEKPILFPDITYSFYPVWANLYGIPYEVQPLDESFGIRTKDYEKANGGVIFPNPNAPTGLCLEPEAVTEILMHNQDVIVIVDEAYIDFGGISALPLLERFENLLVVGTFSKSRAMAGMRIGYAFGGKKLIKALNNVKYAYNSYTMNLPSLVMGVAAVKDQEYFQQTLLRIVKTREETKQWLGALGFSFPDSRTNFIFASHEQVSAGEIYQELRNRNIYVRHFAKPRIDNYLRITIGTDEEMAKLRLALTQILAAHGK